MEDRNGPVLKAASLFRVANPPFGPTKTELFRVHKARTARKTPGLFLATRNMQTLAASRETSATPAENSPS